MMQVLGAEVGVTPQWGWTGFAREKVHVVPLPFSLFLQQLSPVNQTHNSLLKWICFTFGSAVESPRDVVCRTKAFVANRDHVPHIGQVLGGDSLRSATVSLTLVWLPGCLCHMLRSSYWL